MKRALKKEEKGMEQRENDIKICLCAEGLMLLPGSRQGGPLGVLCAGWAVAASRVWGPSLEERMRTAGHPAMAKTLHIGCSANDTPGDRNSLAPA